MFLSHHSITYCEWSSLIKTVMFQQGHSQTGTFLHREIITLWEAFMRNRGNTSCSTHNVGTASSLSTLTEINHIQHDLLSTSKEFTSARSFELWSIYMVHEYLKISIQNCHGNTERILCISHTGVNIPWGSSPQNKQGYNQIDPNPQGYTRKRVIAICALHWSYVLAIKMVHLPIVDP